MARKKILRKGAKVERKTLRCMNADPDNSKWGAWAPVGGCQRRVEVDAEVNRVLCWECTSHTTTNPLPWRQEAMPD